MQFVSPMNLPDHTEVSGEALRAITERHGLPLGALVRLPETGIINAVYALGDDLILRVPRDHPGHVAPMRREAAAVPAARAVGVRTPALVVFDDTGEILPVPYAIYERVHGATLGLLEREASETPEVWRELGRDLGRLHAGVQRTGPAGALADGHALPDPRQLVERRAGQGWFTGTEARWLQRWLERLAPAALARVDGRFVHADTQPTNVMVSARDRDAPTYRALIDWGCAQWGDEAIDVACAPLGAAPLLLQGHREIAPLAGDETAEARVVWAQWQITLDTLPRGAVPGYAWGENPVARLLETMRFFSGTPRDRWAPFAPC